MQRFSFCNWSAASAFIQVAKDCGTFVRYEISLMPCDVNYITIICRR